MTSSISRALLVILLCMGSAFGAWAEEPPTYAEDIAPILHQHCVACHRPDGGAPFNFMDEKDPVRRSRLLARVVETKFMPPWKVSDSDYDFANARGLTNAEIATFRAWHNAGAPLGDLSQAPEPPAFASEWNIGEPDVVVQEEKPFSVPAEGPDIYRNSVIALPPTPEGKYIRALEYKPSAKTSTHHCLIYVDKSGSVRKFIELRPDETVDLPIVLNRDRIEAWAVGQVMFAWPDGIRRSFPDGTDLVLQTHYHPLGKPEIGQASIGVYYDDSPPTRQYINFDVPFGFGVAHNIRIPPGEKRYTVHDEFEVKGNAKLSIIYPHAHSLCTGMESVAHFPDGTEKLLIRLQNWDFAWQERYLFAEAIDIPAGTIFKNQFWYDNSAENLSNPFDPPREVTFGPDSTDEMAAFTYAFMSDSQEEIDKIAAGYGEKAIADLADADMRIPLKGIWKMNVLPRVDKNGDGEVALGEWIRVGAREAYLTVTSGVGPMDGITDDYGVQSTFEKKIALTVIQVAITDYWHILALVLFAGIALLAALVMLSRRVYRSLRPAHA